MDRLDPVAADLEFEHLVRADFALLDQGAAADHHEELPLGVVPVLPLGDAGFGDIDRHLAAVRGFQQLGEAAARVHLHVEREGGLFLRQVGQVGAVQLFSEAAGRHLRQQQRLRLGLEALQQRHDLAQRGLMRGRDIAIAPVRLRDGVQPGELAAVRPAFQRVQHLLHQVVDVDQLQLGGGVVHPDGQVVCNIVAEGRHRAVVVGAAPLAEQVREAVHQHRRAGLFAVSEKQLLPGQLALAVIALAIAAEEGRLDGAGQHDGARIAVLFQGIQQRRGKAEVALHELALLLRAVDAGQVEHKVRLGAVGVEQGGTGVQVVLINFADGQARAGPVFAFSNVAQVADEVLAHKALCAGDEDVHFRCSSQFFSASCT